MDNKHVSEIAEYLSNRIAVAKEIQLPIISAIREQAQKFDGKVLNRRFTTAVTKALEGNGHRISVRFRENWCASGKTEYDVITANYYTNGKYCEFTIYPDRTKVKDYTDEDGRLVAEKLKTTCDRYEENINNNIKTDKDAINLAPEFVSRVEDIKSTIESLNRDYPMALRAFIAGNLDFRR